MLEHDKIYIDGAWVPSTGHRAPSTCSTPPTARSSARIPDGNAADVDAAAKAAAAAFPEWSAKSPEERAKFCTRIAEGLGARMDEIATVVTREAGMPKWLSLMVQAGLPDQLVRHAPVSVAESYEYETTVGNSLVVKEPVGVVGCHHAVELPAPPDRRQGRLRDGRRLHRRAQAERGRPARRLHPRRGHPRRRRCRPACSTSSPAPAPRSARPSPATRRSTWCPSPAPPAPARPWPPPRRDTLKRVALELGGKSANILLDDLDDEAFEKAVRDGVGKAYLNSGQTCTALTRMLVPAGRLADAERIAADEVETKFQPQDPFADFAMLGPLSSQAQVDRVNGYIQKGIDEGAKLVTGGTGKPEGLERRLLREAHRVLRGHATT